MKSVLISIQPRWCELIASGEKTLEVRKTKPKLETPFKCYIYCTLPPKTELFTHGCIREYLNELIRLQSGEIVYGYGMQLCCDPKNRPYTEDNFLCQKIIGEFICDAILSHCEMANADIAEAQSCVSLEKILEYSGGYEVYGWHISDLKIYNKPMKLDQFRKPIDCHRGKQREDCVGCWECEIKRPPQSWCYVEA